MFSPRLCGSSVDNIMEPIKSTSHLSRVKTMLSSSPLGRRRHSSSGNIPAIVMADTKSHNGLIWGVSLDKLVAQHKSKHQVPFIVEKIVEYVEKHGLCQEGLYRVNGNAKVIEKLKASFDKTGDAEFDDVDIAALGGLLKQFLRDIPVPLITEDIAEKFVKLHNDASSYTTQQYYEQIRILVKQLPVNHYHLLKYLVNHLVTVAKHENDNKMSAVSLSIVFGPNVFRCEGGLAGLQRQGVCNSFLSKIIMKCDKVFMDDDKVWINQVKEEAMQRRGKPQKPLPYSARVENLNNTEESNDSGNLPSSSCGHGSLTSPTHMIEISTTDDDINERNIDECVACSPPASHELSRPHQLSRSHDSDPDLGTGQFIREVGVRRRLSLEAVKRKSLSPQREEEVPRTPSPWSQISNSSVSPNSSPVQPTSHVMSQYLALVIEQTVKQLLFGPGKSRDPMPSTVPTITTKQISSARQRRKVSSGSKGSKTVTGNVKNDTSNDVESKDHSSNEPAATTRAVDTSSNTKQNDQRVIMRRRSSKEEKDRKRLNRDSGALFSDSIDVRNPFSVDQIDGNTESSQSEGVTGQVKPHQKKSKPTVKGFDMFESLGLVMGAPISQRSNNNQPLNTTPIASADDKNCHHFVMTPLESYDEEDSLSQSTGAYSIKLADTTLAEDDLDAVKSTVKPLEHLTMHRSAGPSRRLPRNRIRSTPTLGSNPGLTSTNKSTSVSHPVPETTAVKDGSKPVPSPKPDPSPKPVPSPKPKPRHHKDYSRTNSDLHTTSSDLHTKTTRNDSHIKTQRDSYSEITNDSNLHHRTTSDLHSVDPFTQATGQSPKLQPKSPSNSDAVTDAEMIAGTIETTSGQSKVKVVEVLAKPLATNTSDFQTRDIKTTSSVQSYHIDTNADDDDVTDGPASAKLQAKPLTKNPSTTSGSNLHISSHSKTTSDLPVKSVSDSHHKTNADLHTVKTDNSLRTRIPDSHHASVTLDVVSDHFVEQTDVGWGSTPEVIAADGETTSELHRRLKEIKRSVRKYEDGYKAQHGVKPSGTDKDPIRPLLKEYSSVKKQLQQSMSSLTDNSDGLLSKTTSADELLSKTAPAKLSELPQNQHKIIDQDSDEIKVKRAALDDCQQSLADNRQKAGRPDNVDHMSIEQLQEEKISVQRVLLAFEKQYGRPQADDEREVMRPLYNYYRQLKKIISGRGSISSNKSEELALTTVSMAPVQDNTATSLDTDSLCGTLRPSHNTLSPKPVEVAISQQSTEDIVSSSDSVEQLGEQLNTAMDEKRRLRLIIHEYETEFQQQHGRPIKDKEDRHSIQHHYDAYKRIKAHIKLIETLMAKKDSNVTV